MSEQDEYGDLPISSEFVEKLNSLTDDEAENRARALRSGRALQRLRHRPLLFRVAAIEQDGLPGRSSRPPPLG